MHGLETQRHTLHELSADLAKYYPQNRRPSKAEVKTISEMSKINAPIQKITETINRIRENEGKVGKMVGKTLPTPSAN